jgi:hypothetical protein
MNWDKIIHALVLIRMGQELGTDNKLSMAVHAVLDLLIGVFK